jgi:DNA replication protein DnaC
MSSALTASNVSNVRKLRICFNKIIAARNQKRSTAVVTNVDFEKWGEYLTDGPLAMAFLDRLVERAIVLKVTGKSYRAWLAQQAAEAEAAKKKSN